MQCAVGAQLVVGEEVGVVWLAVDGERLDVGAVTAGLDADTATPWQMQRYIAE